MELASNPGHNGVVNQTLEIIAGRFACRAFADTPIPRATLRAITEAGLHSPSAMNRQPWRLIVVDDRAQLAELGEVGLAALKISDPAGYERIMGRGGQLLYNAPALILIAREQLVSEWSPDLDVGIMASHLALAAGSLGINSCIAALPGVAFTGADGLARARKLGIPEGFDFGLSVLLGYKAKDFTPHAIDPSKVIGLDG